MGTRLANSGFSHSLSLQLTRLACGHGVLNCHSRRRSQQSREFVKTSEVAVEQLCAARTPVDATLGERLSEDEGRIRDHRRQERNLLRVAAESAQVDLQALWMTC